MGYLGTPPQSGFITTAKQRVTSSTNNYVDLDHAISSIADVIVFVNFVKQDTTNLTLTTSTRITLGGTLVSSDVVEIHYLGKAVNTQTPSAGTVTSDMLAGSIANSKLANSSIYFSMKDIKTGIPKLINKPASIVAKQTISPNAPTEYYIFYKWTKKDVSKEGRFEGQFIIYFHDDGSELIAPIRENLYINISDSFVKSPC